MPNNSNTSNGPYPSIAQMPVRFQTFTFAGAGAQNSNVLFANGLPGLRVWVLQTLGPGAISVLVQFADGNDGVGAPDFQQLVPTYAVALAVPSLNQFSLGSRRYRVQIQSTGVATARVRLSAILT